MADKFKKALDSLEIGEPLFVRNLVIYPLSNGAGVKIHVQTFEEGLHAGTVTVSELDVPSVTEVLMDNSGDEPLFLLDGDEIFGAQQTRVTTTAALIEARSSVNVPVACIEEGRWQGSHNFTGSMSSTHPRLRSILCSGVNSSLRQAKSFLAPQRLVWDEITRELDSLTVSSATSSFHDLARSLADQTERYLIDAGAFTDSHGMIVSAGKEVLGLEYFSDPDLLVRLAPRVLRGYALSGLERRSADQPPRPRELAGLISRLSAMEHSSYPGVSSGEEWRFADERFVGRALIADDVIFQASFFPRVN